MNKNKNQRRFEDAAGRIYTLPSRNNEIFKHFVELGEVDEENFERDLLNGLQFDAERDLRVLTNSVMFEVKLEKTVKHESWAVAPLTIDPLVSDDPLGGTVMPAVTNTARDRQGVLILREINTGFVYSGRIDLSLSKRRSKVGVVVVRNLQLINRGARVQRIS